LTDFTDFHLHNFDLGTVSAVLMWASIQLQLHLLLHQLLLGVLLTKYSTNQVFVPGVFVHFPNP
ncbi:hypothetical protein M9458_043355, partial [Cirrhinus mrigala]